MARGPMKAKQLSTMEHTVLGIVWQSGPCTTYAVMKELRSSGSTYYRDRAGTTYPIVERLVGAKLLRYQKATGTRGDRQIETTALGIKRLREWLSPPIPLAEVGLMRDLLRLRVFFLAALEPAERKAFLTQARITLEEHLAQCSASIGAHSDPFVRLADLGAVRETEARIAWIDEITPAILALPRSK